MDSEPGVLPTFEKLDPFLGDFLFLEAHLEELLAKEILERVEVDVLGHGVEDAVAGEDSEGRESVTVGMVIEEIAEGLRCRQHGGDRLLEAGELRLEEGPGGGVARATHAI